ncbi:hypothetical protein ACFOPX_05035 [Helicobacter baculiformis]|uniref:KaiC-like domain-containing protein n=1 Tax=Helicobacter baculiformis TaxID=427351 RepID=A0ABV7ZI82_9HELI|nr:hypothetical protein [Helicobacter baculiformis]
MQFGRLVLVSGDPDAGKTILTTQILEYVAKKYKVAHFCLEFPIRAHVEKLLEEKRHFKGMDDYILEDRYNDLSDLTLEIRTLAKRGVKVFLIDSQKNVACSGSSTEERETPKFIALGQIARQMEVLVLFIIQTAKAGDRLPFGSKLAGHEADVHLHIERLNHQERQVRPDEDPSFKRKITILKNKQTTSQGFAFFSIEQGYFKTLSIPAPLEQKKKTLKRLDD